MLHTRDIIAIVTDPRTFEQQVADIVGMPIKHYLKQCEDKLI